MPQALPFLPPGVDMDGKERSGMRIQIFYIQHLASVISHAGPLDAVAVRSVYLATNSDPRLILVKAATATSGGSLAKIPSLHSMPQRLALRSKMASLTPRSVLDRAPRTMKESMNDNQY